MSGSRSEPSERFPELRIGRREGEQIPHSVQLDTMGSANKRGCRCSGSEKTPGGQEPMGLQRGYCGLCVVCGEPGHIRQHPGAGRFTGTWCDLHYRVLAFTHPVAPVGTFLWLTVVASAIFAARHFVHY